MKGMISVLLPFLFSLFTCCSAPGAGFQSPNNVKNIEGTLFLLNGDSVNGNLYFNNEVMLRQDIKVYPASGGGLMNIHLVDVKGYRTGNNYYELQHLRNSGLATGGGFYFMKRLTPENSRIQLYEHLHKRYHHKSANRITYESKYYVQFPGEYDRRVWSLDSEKFVPHFHWKMSKLVAQCKPLAEKISRKQANYFYSRVVLNPETRLAVMKNIITEYNQCR